MLLRASVPRMCGGDQIIFGMVYHKR